MFDPVSAGIIAGGSIIGNLAGGAMEQSATEKQIEAQFEMQKRGNEFNSAQAWNSYLRQNQLNREARDFEERMSNSAYQRRMKDLRAAGLNPMLAIKGGGADTPSVSAGTAPQASGVSGGTVAKSNVAEYMAKGISGAFDAVRLSKELEGIDANVDLSKAAATEKYTAALVNTESAKSLAANTELVEPRKYSLLADIDLTKSRTKSEDLARVTERLRQHTERLHQTGFVEDIENKKLKNDLIKLGIPAERAEAILREKQAEFDISANKFDNITRRVGETIGSIVGGVGLGAGLRKIFRGGPGVPGTREGDRYRGLLEKKMERDFNRRTKDGGFGE